MGSPSEAVAPLLKTPLNDVHRRLNARMVDFAGWEMPVQYSTGILAEHEATRTTCGLFDLSHMGRVLLRGVDALALRIRKVAEENKVPVVENPPLARALYAAVEIEETIPPEQYKAVAQVIGYVMKLTGKRAH